MNKYYLYCFLDPNKPGKYMYEGLNMSFLYEPFYIVKGSGDRIKAHFYPSNLKIKNYKNNKIKNIINSGNKPIVEIIINNLSEIDSYILEKDFVSKIGRVDIKSGPLTNLTDGGYGALNLQLPTKRLKVYQFDLNENLIKEYESITSAAILNKLHISDIHKCCKHKANTHGNYFWSYKKENNNFVINKLNRKIYKFDINNNLIEIFNSIGEISNKTGKPPGTISRCCKGELLKIDNYYYRYEDNVFNYRKKIKKNKPVLVINNNSVEEFESVKKASEILKISIKNIIHRCKNKFIHDDLYLIYKDEYESGIRKIYKKQKHNEKIILKFDILGNLIKKYNSLSEAAMQENLSRGYLGRNIDKNIKGYIYRSPTIDT